MAPVRRVVYDVLKPHEPEMRTFVERIASVDGVSAADASLVEIDQEVQNIMVTVDGDDLPPDTIEETIEDLGGTVHSVDRIACGDHVPAASGANHGPTDGPGGPAAPTE
ncbi:MAG: DUF211 domain-containing protein [Halodesulfurarchaeum sp.]